MPETGRLWAPWRSRFIRTSLKRRRACIFCRAASRGDDRTRHVVGRGEHVFCLLNRYPYTNGHAMIAPYRHVGQLERLNEPEWLEMLRMSRQLLQRLRRVLHQQGFNLGMNLGRSAGSGIPGHVHLHLVPRWVGDTNFMSIAGDARVLSQSLDELYGLLKEP